MVQQILACPRCKGELSEHENRLICHSCGDVGKRTLGFYDFLDGQSVLALAGGGSFDLDADRDEAARLVDSSEGLTFAQLLRAPTTNDGGCTTLAEQKFADRYWQTCEEVGFSHGRAILTKVNGYLAHHGHQPIPGGTVIEAGGGQ